MSKPTRAKEGPSLTERPQWRALQRSKNRITDDTIRLLLSLAEACSLRERIEAMFRGDKINATEQRAVLHIALTAERAYSRRWQECRGK